jgi:hypothetical protein
MLVNFPTATANTEVVMKPEFDDRGLSNYFSGADDKYRRGSIKAQNAAQKAKLMQLAEQEEAEERRLAEEEAAKKASAEAARLGPNWCDVEVKTSRDLERDIFGLVGNTKINTNGTLTEARLSLCTEAQFIKPPYRFLFVTRSGELVSTNKEPGIIVKDLFKKGIVKIHMLRGKEVCTCGKVFAFKCEDGRGYCSEECRDAEAAAHGSKGSAPKKIDGKKKRNSLMGSLSEE